MNNFKNFFSPFSIDVNVLFVFYSKKDLEDFKTHYQEKYFYLYEEKFIKNNFSNKLKQKIREDKIEIIIKFLTNGKGIEFYQKHKKIWRFIDQIYLNSLWISENVNQEFLPFKEQIINNYYENVLKKLNIKFNSLSTYFFDNGNICRQNNNLLFQIEKIISLNLAEIFYKKEVLIKQFNHFIYKKNFFKTTETIFNEAIKNLKENKISSNLNIKFVKEVKEDQKFTTFFFISKNSQFSLQYNNETKTTISEFITITDNFTYLNQLVQTLNRLFNSLFVIKLPKKFNFKTKQKFLIIFGIIVFVLSFFLTFFFFYDFTVYQNAFLVINESWCTAWIYLLIINWFITTFFAIFLILIFDYATTGKIKRKNLFSYFIATQIKFFSYALTGNHLISLFIFSFYLNKKMNMKVINIAGLISAQHILRGLINFSFGAVSLIIGSYYLNVYTPNANQQLIILLIVVAWIGLIYSTIMMIGLGFIFISDTLHNIYLFIYLYFISHFTKRNYFNEYNRMENQLLQLKQSSNRILKNRKTLLRIFILFFFYIIFEGIETACTYNMIIHYAITTNNSLPPSEAVWTQNLKSGDYYKYNIVEIAGIRSIVKNISHLAFTPGGLYLIEVVMGNVYFLVFSSNFDIQPIIDPRQIFVINQASYVATLITRFFNYYIKFIISGLITMIVIIRQTINKSKSKEI